MSVLTRERPGVLSPRRGLRILISVVAVASALAFGGALHHAPAAAHAIGATHTAPLACGGINLPCIPTGR